MLRTDGTPSRLEGILAVNSIPSTFGLILLSAGPALAQADATAPAGSVMDGIAGLLIIILIGAVAGWLASLIVRGEGSGALMNIVFGILGATIAGRILPVLGVQIGGWVGSFIAALIGAIVMILIFRFIRGGSDQ